MTPTDRVHPGRRRLRLALLSCLAAPLLVGATCSPRPDPKMREKAEIHYDLGVQSVQNNDARRALIEFQKAVELDPKLDLAHHALGLLHHLSFGQPDVAITHYQRALELNPKFSEAYTNLANVYLAQGRYDEAIPLYEKALADLLYKTPYIAENNLGWAYFKKGEVRNGIDHIRSALLANPKFCLGHRNLGQIHAESGQHDKSAESYAAYVKNCPESADAHHLLGASMLKLGDNQKARASFQSCAEKGASETLGDECRKLVELLDQQ